MLLSAIPLSFSQMSRGMIENMLEDDATKNCEIISFQDGMYIPLRVTMSYPTTPNTSVPVKGDNPETQFSADITNESFFFYTNSTDHFRIAMNLDYDTLSDKPRNIFYEVFTENNVLTQVGSWQSTEQSICRILSIFTSPPPQIKTDEEIIAIVNEDNIKRDGITQNLIQGVLDLISIIAIVGTSVGLTFIIYIIMLRISKNNDLRKTQLVTKQFTNAVNRFDNAMKNLKIYDQENTMKIDLIINTIKSHFHDVLLATAGLIQEIKSKTPDEPSNINVEHEISLFSKVKGTVLDQLDIKNKPVEEKSFEEKYYNMTDDELRDEYEKLRVLLIKSPDNNELRKHCEFIVKELRDRE
jgi:hypothetical protein